MSLFVQDVAIMGSSVAMGVQKDVLPPGEVYEATEKQRISELKCFISKKWMLSMIRGSMQLPRQPTRRSRSYTRSHGGSYLLQHGGSGQSGAKQAAGRRGRQSSS